MGSGGLSFCLGFASLKPGEQGVRSLVLSSAGWLPIGPCPGVAGKGWCLLADWPHSMSSLLRNLLAPEAVFWVIFPLLNQHKMAGLETWGVELRAQPPGLAGWGPALLLPGYPLHSEGGPGPTLILGLIVARHASWDSRGCV